MSPPAHQRAERTPIVARTIAPLNAARTAQRTVPTKDRVKLNPASTLIADLSQFTPLLFNIRPLNFCAP
jgi:hypothetical protein